MRHPAFASPVDREQLLEWYRRSRRRSAELFAIPTDEAYYDAPIALRNPIAFYEGHLPAFSVNTLVKAAHGQAGIDGEKERLFARGIDPESIEASRPAAEVWPSRDEILRYAAEADTLVERALATGSLHDPSVPHLRNGEAVFTILEHEDMHQETFIYMLHNLTYSKKRRPLGLRSSPSQPSRASKNEWITVPAGDATLGAAPDDGFGWDNEFPRLRVHVDAFSMQRFNVTNGEFLDFVDGGGYSNASLWSPAGLEWLRREGVSHPHFWRRDGNGWKLRNLFEEIDLPADWPVYVTQAEAEAFARWKGARLPTEAEWHRAATGTPQGIERRHPWGDEQPDATRGNFDFANWDPVAVGSFPAGASAWGIEDLVGNGWEWTSTEFAPFPGFVPMPSYREYSADFFDGRHYVLKGASPLTARSLIRRSFRNWFRPAYPYVYGTFRCVR